uniref:Uncharacterized protein n=1 Tax=Pan paniscus TaxID=9597 RepID=A0A2R9BZ54_PANPA
MWREIPILQKPLIIQVSKMGTGQAHEDEQNGKQKWREEGGEAGRKREREKEEKMKRTNPSWILSGHFFIDRQNQYPYSCINHLPHLIFLQISQWFCKTRKKYNKEMSKRKHKKKHTGWRSLCCQGWSRTPALK